MDTTGKDGTAEDETRSKLLTVAPNGITNRAIVSLTCPEDMADEIETGMVAADDAEAKAMI